MKLKLTLRNILDRLLNCIDGSDYVDRQQFLGFDGVLVKRKKIVTYCIIYDYRRLPDPLPDLPIDKPLLRRWDKLRGLFGPIPLAIFYASPDEIYAKRISASWEAEYKHEYETCIVPSAGAVKLNALT
jgi:hypothetical protein